MTTAVQGYIELSDDQWREAIAVGSERVIQSRHLQHRNGMSDNHRFDYNVEGAAGEYAVALFLGIQWDKTVNTFRTVADVGKNIEVKTRSEYNYGLITRQWDRENLTDTKLFVHVTGRSPEMHVRGWIRSEQFDIPDNQTRWAQEAQKMIRNDRPLDNVWMVPNEELNQNWDEFKSLVVV